MGIICEERSLRPRLARNYRKCLSVTVTIKCDRQILKLGAQQSTQIDPTVDRQSNLVAEL
ncbi:hypothetical protein [Chamaesiphon sp.]|uniref:hypothetical protein n=1 Tax=Chamaesiphon sp. TaxID=2814140 RepID=UPI0035939057